MVIGKDLHNIPIRLTIGQILSISEGNVSEIQLKAMFFDAITAHQAVGKVQVTAPPVVARPAKAPPRNSEPDEYDLSNEEMDAEVDEEFDEILNDESGDDEDEDVKHGSEIDNSFISAPVGNAAVQNLLARANRSGAGVSKFADTAPVKKVEPDDDDDEDEEEEAPRRPVQQKRPAPKPMSQRVGSGKVSSEEDRLKSIQSRVDQGMKPFHNLGGRNNEY